MSIMGGETGHAIEDIPYLIVSSISLDKISHSSLPFDKKLDLW